MFFVCCVIEDYMLQALCYSDGNIIISLVNNNVKTVNHKA